MNATLAAAGRFLGSFDQHATARSLTAAGVCDVKLGRSPESTWFTTAASGILLNGACRS
eukprot:CAMPEP_0198692576 /NCGR_PEP_ID=MMETSP1468-20131203/230633_1 /TAXON_ID=1461545 /ORGANISM="Mantoniella sp, Strain CCMP1436" /LENGTH=58 /DNA_ID=CAMNT_0044446583 /DNA_START=371 /DNA_END=547 /DNA_ORIENTATION=-